MNDSKDHSQLHFKTIRERHLIKGHFPDRINSNGKDTVIKLFNKGILGIIDDGVATTEDTKI